MQELFNRVDALSNDDFEALIIHINRQKRRRAHNIISEAQRQASRFLQEDGGSYTKAKAPAKFRNPQNPELTWSGFGRKPNWYIEYIQKGGNEKDLII